MYMQCYIFMYNIKANFIYLVIYIHVQIYFDVNFGAKGAWESNVNVCCNKHTYKFSLSYLEY